MNINIRKAVADLQKACAQLDCGYCPFIKRKREDGTRECGIEVFGMLPYKVEIEYVRLAK